MDEDSKSLRSKDQGQSLGLCIKVITPFENPLRKNPLLIKERGSVASVNRAQISSGLGFFTGFVLVAQEFENSRQDGYNDDRQDDDGEIVAHEL